MNFNEKSTTNQLGIKNTILLTLVILVSILIISTIPLLESGERYFMGFVLIPQTLALIYIILNQNNKLSTSPNKKVKEMNESKGKVFHWREEDYIFSRKSLIRFILGAPLLSGLLFLFFMFDLNIWLQEVTTKQTQVLLNIFFGVPSQVSFNPDATVPWTIFVSGAENPFGISLFCTAVHIFCIFAGIIICIPHSQIYRRKNKILWRKAKVLTLTIIFNYVINLLRLVSFLFLVHVGFNWELTHSILLYSTSIIGAVIFFIFLYWWVPELFIAIYSMPSVLKS